MSGHRAIFINDLQEARYYIDQIGAAEEAYVFMAPKAIQIGRASCRERV